MVSPAFFDPSSALYHERDAGAKAAFVNRVQWVGVSVSHLKNAFMAQFGAGSKKEKWEEISGEVTLATDSLLHVLFRKDMVTSPAGREKLQQAGKVISGVLLATEAALVVAGVLYTAGKIVKLPVRLFTRYPNNYVVHNLRTGLLFKQYTPWWTTKVIWKLGAALEWSGAGIASKVFGAYSLAFSPVTKPIGWVAGAVVAHPYLALAILAIGAGVYMYQNDINPVTVAKEQYQKARDFFSPEGVKDPLGGSDIPFDMLALSVGPLSDSFNSSSSSSSSSSEEG